MANAVEKRITDHSDSFVHRSERPWPNPRLKRAAIVGHTTTTTTTLWVRTGSLGKFKLLLFPEDQTLFDELCRNATITETELARLCAGVEGLQALDFAIESYDDDTTHTLHIDRLRPSTCYSYLVLNDLEDGTATWVFTLGRDRAVSKQGSGYDFRTLHDGDDAFSFAFFSCHNPYVEEGLIFQSKEIKVVQMEAWHVLLQTLRRHSRKQDKPLEFILAGGDQVYADGRPGIDIWRFLYGRMRKQGSGANAKLLPELPAMLSWYRDIYRGYWGFQVVREVFSHFPTYMIWDDHEIGDGWGSFDAPDGKYPHPIYAAAKEKGLSRKDADVLLQRMFAAAREAYIEYEHSHNPQLGDGKLHYHFRHHGCAFFVLDGRGHRDFTRKQFRIHGESQLQEFARFADAAAEQGDRFLFVLSAVPLLHTTDHIVGITEKNVLGSVMRKGKVADDLRDAWEHEAHDEERRWFKEVLWRVAAKGVRVCILSGDVHASAAFRLEKRVNGKLHRIYQLTSSAITYHLSWLEDKVAKFALPASEDGDTADGEAFMRLALSTESPYAILQVKPQQRSATFQLYGIETMPLPGSRERVLRSNSKFRLELWGDDAD